MIENTSSVENIQKFIEDGFKQLINATKSSNRLPFGKSRDLYESYPCFNSLMKCQGYNVLQLLSNMMRHAGCRANVKARDDEEKMEMLIEANDWILEKVGRNLDEILGICKYPELSVTLNPGKAISGSWNVNDTKKNIAAAQILNDVLNKTKNMEKPQLYFKEKANNDRNSKFEPKIKYKYNMLKPLAILEEVNENGEMCYSHPYEFELNHFKPLTEQLNVVEPKLYKSLEETPLKFITKVEEVTSMIDDIKKYKEIAVDLEHHSYRSFQGFTCLIQISTRDTDYVIDALVLRSDLGPLNEVFTDPRIVKIFHGGLTDSLWLQKDFGIYIVNMFDTYHASKLLEYSSLSLAYLVQRFCKVMLQKQYRLADWRIRPLPEELLHYAREDTHYLPYIYDNLKNLIIEKANGKTNLLESILSEGTRNCLERYEKPVWNEDSYLDIYHKSKKLFDNRQKYALKELFEWRDNSARNYDESYGYVLPNHMMLSISESLPREAQGILACCNPIPVLVKKHLLNLHQIILKAREQPLVEPVFEERRFHRPNAEDDLTTNNRLRCPHDLNFDLEFRDDLPVLFSEKDPPKKFDDTRDVKLIALEPIVNIFECPELRSTHNLFTICKSSLLTPYERYKLTKPFNEKEAADVQAKLKLKEEPREKVQEDFVQPAPPKEKPVVESLTQKIKEENKRKRKLEGSDDGPSKKIKSEQKNMVKNPYYENTDVKPEQKQNEKKKINEVRPFNYSNVDFDKYQTYNNDKPKKHSGKNPKRRKFRKK